MHHILTFLMSLLFSGDLYWNPDRTFAPFAPQDDFCPDKPSPDIAFVSTHRFTQALLKDPQ